MKARLPQPLPQARPRAGIEWTQWPRHL